MMGQGRWLWALGAGALLVTCVGVGQPASTTDWAYPVSPPAAPTRFDTVRQLTIPNGATSFTEAGLKDLFETVDWRPGDHPPMPQVVAHGRKPDVMACGYCHLPTGDGRPENAPLAGLPRDYIVEQMRAMRSGERRSSIRGRAPTENMEKLARATSDEEIAAAADYFSALPHHSHIRVVESDRVPRTLTKGWLYSRDPAGGSEAIGARIIEMPDDFQRFERRDPAIGYVAYAPRGSIARGAALARDWGGSGREACASCHGNGLHGAGNIPPLAGRSPTYIVRQLADFRSGARRGAAAAAMEPVVAAMTNEDMIALAAFIASRRP